MHRALKYIPILLPGLALMHLLYVMHWKTILHSDPAMYISAMLPKVWWWGYFVVPLVLSILLVANYFWHAFGSPSTKATLTIAAFFAVVSLCVLPFAPRFSAYIGFGVLASVLIALGERGKPNPSLQGRRP